MSDIEIFTQPYCPYCVRAVELLKSKKLSFSEINAPHGTAERTEAIRRSGGRTTAPQIFINGRSIGGCSELLAMERAGNLDALLTSA
ncbi:glutaredoxin [Neoasaia chiangmaiensis NBRC 101099]|uniref:Glutaredoxin n=1 Tax=Neoasaia chiangmaiensis TaxID=320497 RepID=A0A1U9KML3_9PROT|nr:glutaredoxin 3 [Neoasaia chiangmaiensis]AQS87023.1 glutaredoxin [Neoasaia chiangmaiensis]GBR37849.1 glutaredoxin [Neoasaia chiangmaiensis NBRC 101099]GEN15152.1 glutaredoxin 3 [Neoasaia chiangmaiensis]